jgi:outer membrane protein OmpA-like peptidoglycan-associated protein
VLRADRIISLRPIGFEPARETLLPAATKALQDIAALLIDHPEIELVSIEVHTDPDAGSRSGTVSRRRARLIRSELIRLGIRSSRLQAVGFGGERPLDGSQSAGGREKNRRVELRIVSRGSVERVPLP